MKGLFITFEGIECSGKTLQSKLLAEYCSSHNIPYISVREPGGTELGEKLRAILLSEPCTPMAEFLIFSASRAELVNTVIIPKLKDGFIVICDRYIHSSLAYQGYGRKLNYQELKMISHITSSGLDPDITFLLTPSIETAQKRLEHKLSAEGLDRIEKESPEFHISIRNAYQEMARNYHYISELDADLSPQEIHQKIIVLLAEKDIRFL